MTKFILKEIRSSILSIFIFLFLMYYFINILIPGDFLTPLRLMMSQQELDELRASLGADDPIYKQYFRWVISVFSGEITPGGFMRNSSKDITSTIFPTLQILIPSFFLAYFTSRISAIKTPIKRLYKNKIISDSISTLLISLFPPIVYFLISDKVENYFSKITQYFEINKTPTSLIEFSEFTFNFYLFIFLIALVLIFIFFTELLSGINFSYLKLLISLSVMTYIFIALDEVIFNEIIFASKNATKTIIILTVFLFGEYMLMNNVIIQNISREPHILTARALGYSKSNIYKYHILNNSFGPFANRLGLSLPYLIASLVIVESTTSWSGMGSMLYRTILNQDSNAAMGIFLLLALLSTFLRIAISLFHVYIDPRVRDNV